MKKQKRTLLAGLDVPAKRLKLLSEAFPSVLDLSGATVSQLLALDPHMHISEARELLERAKTVAVVTARQFRERRLSSGVRTAFMPETGVKGLVQGPTYTEMFTPNWAEMCPPNAIEATTSPIAYLTDLYREVDKIEATAKGQSFPLATRRPDLAGLMLDHTALNQIVPTLTLSNEILETSISQFLNEHHNGMAVDDALLQTRYPMGLPYERYQQQITYVLGRKKQSPGDAIRCTDIDYPYFKEPGVHSLRSDDALQQDTGFGPEQQSLLLEAPYFPFGGQEQSDKQGAVPNASLLINPRSRLIEEGETRAADFFQRHYGVSDSGELFDTQTFCLRTGITTDELDSLLSVGPYAPTASPNGGVAVTPIDGATFGSVYINGGTSPAIAIETLTDTATGVDGSVVTVTLGHTLVNCTPDRFDRMNRMLRLAKWLKLPFDQVDRLLCASRAAEQRIDSADWDLTADTLRTLGLFQNLRDSHKVSAEEFATLIGAIGLYGLGKEPAQFDRVFNGQALFTVPFVLDDLPFSVNPDNESDRRKVDQMCVALGMSNETYHFCAALIQQAQGHEQLSWSSPVVSAFYRLARLPRYLGLSAIEAAALLKLLDSGGTQLIATLAGIPRVATYQSSGRSDTLSTLHALVDFHLWMVENQWTASMLYQLLLPGATSLIATQTEYSLMLLMSQQLSSALITDSSFSEIGASSPMASDAKHVLGSVPHSLEPINWFFELSEFIHGTSDTQSSKGLVKYLQGETDALFEEVLSARIQQVFDARAESSTNLLPKLVNMIMRARGMQDALLMEGLGNYLTVSVDLAKELLAWVGANREEVLSEVQRVASGSARGQEATLPIDDKVLQILAALSKRAAVTRHLSLSPALVAVFVHQPQWFALPDNTLSLPGVYILSQYTQMLNLSEHTEEQLLDYFRLINSSWPNEDIPIDTPEYEAQQGQRQIIRGSAANKLATLLRWGIREVLKAAAHINPEYGVVLNLQAFDQLVRMRLFEQEVGLDTQALLALGSLTPTSDLETYRYAAELALTSLNETLLGRPANEVGQSNSSVITVSKDYLVANDPSSPVSVITLTLCDLMGQPLPFVDVIWSTDEGSLQSLENKTDKDGQAINYLKAGTVMGVAHVMVKYGLDEMVRAPIITIDCDDASLSFTNAGNAPFSGHANNLDALEFWVTLVDRFGNVGRDRSVDWGTNLGEFQRYMTRTDQQGATRASLRSLNHGIARVVAQLSNGASHAFGAVSFINTPYFEYIQSSGTLTVGDTVFFNCRVIDMDGHPVVGATVKFEVNFPQWEKSAVTRGDGGCSVNYISKQEGKGLVKVSFVYEGKTVVDVLPITVFPAFTVVDPWQSSLKYAEGDPAPIEFSIYLQSGGSFISGVYVVWRKLGSGVGIHTKTDGTGYTRFKTKEFKRGSNIWVAETASRRELARFEVEGVEKFTLKAVLISPDAEHARPNFLSSNKAYILNVKAFNAKGEVVEGVRFKLLNLGASLELLGVSIPDIDVEIESSLQGHDYSVRGTLGRNGVLTLGVKAIDQTEIFRLDDYTLGQLFYISAVKVTQFKMELTYTLFSGALMHVPDYAPVLKIYVDRSPVGHSMYNFESTPDQGDGQLGGLAYSIPSLVRDGSNYLYVEGSIIKLPEVVAEGGHVVLEPHTFTVALEPDAHD
ncbi:Tc toxin subunit A [Pseudomonas sp.]|uniref:Tc toxin subunit A n=1 Tax=Pseudomonas sp. TaxID=306 RepID=UPI0026331F2E|nr:Tc toxin subunit A [Pseudomonas sp.]